MVWLSILDRETGGQEAEMRRLLTDGATLTPANDDDRARLEATITVRTVAFTSVNICQACEESSDGPARVMSRLYGELARTLDQSLAKKLATASIMAGAT